MTSLITSIIAAFFVALGGVTVFIMLEMTGRRGDTSNRQLWLHAHKTLGYLFLVIFVVMLFLMIQKASGFQEEPAPRTVVHITLALALIPLVLIKIMIARRYPQHGRKMPMLGVVILTFAFVLTGVSAGHYALYRSGLTYTAPLDSANTTAFGENQAPKDLILPQETQLDAFSSSPNEGRGRILVYQKCNICHSLDRVLKSKKTGQEWGSTVKRMIKNSGDPDFLSEDEESDIVIFLSRRGEKDKKTQR